MSKNELVPSLHILCVKIHHHADIPMIQLIQSKTKPTFFFLPSSQSQIQVNILKSCSWDFLRCLQLYIRAQNTIFHLTMLYVCCKMRFSSFHPNTILPELFFGHQPLLLVQDSGFPWLGSRVQKGLKLVSDYKVIVIKYHRRHTLPKWIIDLGKFRLTTLEGSQGL